MGRETLVSRKVVFDAIVYLQAVANPAGPSGACFDHVRSGTLALITSSETVAELRGLLARPNIRKKFPHLTSCSPSAMRPQDMHGTGQTYNVGVPPGLSESKPLTGMRCCH